MVRTFPQRKTLNAIVALLDKESKPGVVEFVYFKEEAKIGSIRHLNTEFLKHEANATTRNRASEVA